MTGSDVNLWKVCSLFSKGPQWSGRVQGPFRPHLYPPFRTFMATGRQPCTNALPPSTLVYSVMPLNVCPVGGRAWPWMSVGHVLAYAM